MYFVCPESRLIFLLVDLLEEKLTDKAEVKWLNGKLFVRFNDDAGYKTETDYLSQEEIDRGVCGGGVKQALDGCEFEIKVEKVSKGV